APERKKGVNIDMYRHQDERLKETSPKLNSAAQKAYVEFIAQWAPRLDLSDPDSIGKAYTAGIGAGILEQATEVRKYYYGNLITTYGVSYVSDACVENCAFCPAGKWNRGYRAKTLTTKETVADVLCTMLQGHRRTCILQANWSESRFLAKLEEWLPEVIRVCAPLGLVEIILNVQTLSKAGYRIVTGLKNRVNPELCLQVRTFQETYNAESYATLIPPSPMGNKGDMRLRLQGQSAASLAGIDAVGCGVLFGLNSRPLEELAALVRHAQDLLDQDINLVRICLPSAHGISGLKTRIPFDLSTVNQVYWQFSQLVYALARLALPEMNWVMSERDPANLRDELAAYATETTVGVKPGVGDNLAAALDEQKGAHFVQATTYSEKSPEGYVRRTDRMGYKVDLNLSQAYRQPIQTALKELGFCVGT
ncbi:MAG: hypothetical protein WCG94_07465, partial [Methanothrix sp.]